MIVKILSVSLIALALSGCALESKNLEKCSSYNLAHIATANSIHIYDRKLKSFMPNQAREATQTPIVIENEEGLNFILGQLSLIGDDWEPVIFTAAATDYLLKFYQDDKHISGIFMSMEWMYSGGCVKALPDNIELKKLHGFVEKAFNNKNK